MNREDLFKGISGVDEDILERSEKDTKKKTVWLKCGALAACLALAVIAGISVFRGNDTGLTSVGGVMREYKNTSVGSSESAIEWPWEYKTVYERFTTIIFEGKEYTVKTLGMSVDEALLGDEIGTGEAVGYDIYTEQEYRQNVEVRQIKGISADLMVAAGLEGNFYTFKYNEYVPPATLGEVLDNYSLSQNLTCNNFSVYKDGKETGYYSLANDDYIWQILSECRDAKFVEDEEETRFFKNRITFTATSESLGVYKRVFYVSADGYVNTNVFDWAYTFYIGEEAATDIISYAKKNGSEREREPYTYSLAGTLTEIGDGYVLVDDSILCIDESDGMVFKVLTSDLRISRCLDYGKFNVGTIVVVNFTEPVNVEAGNVVSGAISMDRGVLYDGSVAVPE